MDNQNWGAIAARILDYCQTRDSFLRATEITQELVNAWAEELAHTRQSETQLRQAAVSAYRKAAGRPPADPLGAVVAEAKLIARDQQSRNWKDYDLGRPALVPGEQSTDGPIPRCYRVDNAIDYACEKFTDRDTGKTYQGCGAQPGEYCHRHDGRPRRIPCTGRLLIGNFHLTPEERERCRGESEVMQNSYIVNPNRFGRSA